MDHDITVNPVIAGDRRKYRKVFFGKRSVKVTGHIITVAKVGSVETFERFIIRQDFASVFENPAAKNCIYYNCQHNPMQSVQIPGIAAVPPGFRHNV